MSKTVPRAYIDRFSESLESLSDFMKQRLAASLAQVDYTLPVAEVRELLIPIMQAYVYESRGLASQLAAEFYDGLREFELGERIGAVAISGYEPDAVEQRVRSAVQVLVVANDDGGEPAVMQEAADQLVREMQSYVGYSLKTSAGETMFGNGNRDPRRVRYARVPRGSKSYPNGCPFCQMLASRGFVYRSELSAGGIDPFHFHDDCRCTVVPSWGEGSVEGYNPRDYDEGYQEWLEQDHSQHEQNVRERKRNRYDGAGRLLN